MLTSLFSYQLPDELIAQKPPEKRGDSRLMVINAESGIIDAGFRDIRKYLNPGDLLVLNNTRVMAARLFGNKLTGGRVEVLVEKVLSADRVRAFLKSGRVKEGSEITISGYRVIIQGREDNLYILRVINTDWYSLMQEHGHVPLPPYIARQDDGSDLERYQTVYANRPGAVAAPTAGLHFDKKLLNDIMLQGVDKASVTLHVGAGTFQPVKVENIEDHKIHTEWAELSEHTAKKIRQCKEGGGRVIAVGTTVVRTLEWAARNGDIKPFCGETNLFIYPGYKFKAVDMILTNFHLPESTLLMLVSAFAGREPMLRAYQHAIEEKYRFFSYGDAMLIHKPEA